MSLFTSLSMSLKWEKAFIFLELNYNWVYRLGNLNKVEQSFVHLLSQLTHFFDLYAIFISSHQTCHLYVPYSHECLKWHTSLLLFISYFYDRNEIWIHNSFKTISMTARILDIANLKAAILIYIISITFRKISWLGYIMYKIYRQMSSQCFNF